MGSPAGGRSEKYADCGDSSSDGANLKYLTAIECGVDGVASASSLANPSASTNEAGQKASSCFCLRLFCG